MGLAEDLLDQAVKLAHMEAKKPRQASLRRSISAAYYSLFHLLTEACIRRICPPGHPELAARIVRSLAHSEMRDVCAEVARGNPRAILAGLFPATQSQELRAVAQAFLDLQEQRHAADYDTAATFTRFYTLGLIRNASNAFTAWQRVEATDEAVVFLSALLFAKRWGR